MEERTLRRATTLALVVLVTTACGSDSPTSQPPTGQEDPDTLPIPAAGGATTIYDATNQAFRQPAANLAGDRLELFLRGRRGFEALFSPAGVGDDPGLGPLFNESSCEGCHEAGGRTADRHLVRLSAPGVGPHGGPAPVAGFGVQLQDKAVGGVEPEARLDVRWRTVEGAYPDGTSYALREPDLEITSPYQDLPPHTAGLRTPRPFIGLGLLEAVPGVTLQSLADPADADGDGISGRVNMVWDTLSRSMRPGRFGWKANEPGLLQQIATAYLEDMGVTTTVLPVEAFADQPVHHDGLDDDPELEEDRLTEVLHFTQTVAVPARRDVNDAQVQQGEALFASLGCAGCHVPSLQTGTLDGVPEVSGQTIYPYTDLLLHDMGEDLADGRRDFDASGSEWRTPPLWGLGLNELIGTRVELLHDGRARTIEEALLWHGGEAEAARASFMALAADARAALLRFLSSL